ncbi:MAG TPA: hypothetical protein PKE40_03975 [Arachnia sp.]|nr:hypothetical protein [Arachnia sp.]HMT85489.1 hypothetical protein [Arachnia sp.]
MLYLDAPVGPINGLTIFRDHADDDLFYYINDRPRLARNGGVPEFVLLKYKRDVTDNPNLSADDRNRLGGGFLAFTVDLSLDDDVFKAVKNKLGTENLLPVLFQKGTVRLSIDKDIADQPDAPAGSVKGMAFFEDVLGTTKPSLVGDNRATFGVVLDHEGVVLVEAALRSGMSPIGVIYDLEYLGLRPAFNVSVHADYRRIYHELDLQFGLKAAYGPIALAADVDLAWQKLRDNGSITVSVKNFTDDADLRKQADAAFDWFKTQLLQDFFKSSLEPPIFMKQNQGGGVLGQLQTLLGPLTQTQQGPSQPVMGAPTTEAPTVAAPPVGTNAGMVSLAEQNKAQVAGSGTSGSTSATRNATPGLGIQLGFSLKQINQDELKERDFEYSVESAVVRNAAPQGLFSSFVSGLDLSRAIKEIDLDDDFFKRVDTTFTMALDLAQEKIAAVSVNIEYPGDRAAGVQPSHIGGFSFTAQDRDPKHFETFVNARKDLSYRYRLGVDFSGDSEWDGEEPHFESEWVVDTARAITVNPYSAFDRFDLEVLPAQPMPQEVRQIQVELVYENPATGFKAAKTMTFAPTDSGKHWKLRFEEGDEKVYRYRVVYFLARNVRIEGPWTRSEPITTEAGSLVVQSPFRNELSLRVVPLIDAASIVDASLEVIYREPDTGYEHRESIVYSPAASVAPQTIAIPTIAANPQGITTTTTVVREDGSVFAGEATPLTPDQRVVIVSDGVGVTKRITVQLASQDLAGAGLIAVRVRLVGEGENPDRDEAFFDAGAPGSQVVALVQPAEATFGYDYEVIGYTTAGLPREGVRGTSSDQRLVIPLP